MTYCVSLMFYRLFSVIGIVIIIIIQVVVLYIL